MRLLYEPIYRYARAPWDGEPREELRSLAEGGCIKPCRAIDVGCGTGTNAVYLAQHGFDVTGVDFAAAAIEKARAQARAAGVLVSFIVDDLTNLHYTAGTFDFLLDYGVLDDLRPHQRDAYLRNILSLAGPGSELMLWGFEYTMRIWEKLVPFYDVPFYPVEIQRRFGPHFAIEKIAGQIDDSKWPSGYAAYLIKRISVGSENGLSNRMPFDGQEAQC